MTLHLRPYPHTPEFYFELQIAARDEATRERRVYESFAPDYSDDYLGPGRCHCGAIAIERFCVNWGKPHSPNRQYYCRRCFPQACALRKKLVPVDECEKVLKQMRAIVKEKVSYGN